MSQRRDMGQPLFCLSAWGARGADYFGFEVSHVSKARHGATAFLLVRLGCPRCGLFGFEVSHVSKARHGATAFIFGSAGGIQLNPPLKMVTPDLDFETWDRIIPLFLQRSRMIQSLRFRLHLWRNVESWTRASLAVSLRVRASLGCGACNEASLRVFLHCVRGSRNSATARMGVPAVERIQITSMLELLLKEWPSLVHLPADEHVPA